MSGWVTGGARTVVASAPHAAWPTGDGLRVVPLVTARPLSRARLAAWVGALR